MCAGQVHPVTSYQHQRFHFFYSSRRSCWLRSERKESSGTVENIMFQLEISLQLRHMIARYNNCEMYTFVCQVCSSSFRETTIIAKNIRKHDRTATGIVGSENYQFMLSSHARISPVITIRRAGRNIICLFCNLFKVQHELALFIAVPCCRLSHSLMFVSITFLSS